MEISKVLLGGAALLLASVVLADENAKMKMGIVVAESNGTNISSFKIDSDDLDFDLHDLQIGESRSIVDETGRTVLITRGDDGFNFNVDGKTIDFPVRSGDDHQGMVWVSDAGATSMHDVAETMIISAKPIDAATRQAIRDLLGSAGYGSDVNFIERNAAHGRAVMIHKVEQTIQNP